MQVTHFADPACPFDFSAEPQRLQLRWHYGEQLQWKTVLVGLAQTGESYAGTGFTTARLSAGMGTLQRRYGMPIDPSERPRMSGSVRACRAVVATRLNAPEHEDQLLRRLRVRFMGGALLDSDETIAGAASDTGIEPAKLLEWMEHDATQQALDSDMHAARSPSAAARVLDHKLSDSADGGRRYSCPSYEFRHSTRVDVAPGMQPWETYDVLASNVDSALTRRGAAGDAAEVLEWAQMPLATAEVAAIMGATIDDARAQLDAIASFDPVGADGYWALPT